MALSWNEIKSRAIEFSKDVFLFELYKKYTAELFTKAKPKKTKKPDKYRNARVCG